MARFVNILLVLAAVSPYFVAAQNEGEPIVGGYSDIDVNSEDAKKAVKLGVAALEQGADNTNKLKVIRVIKAQQQVVAGTNTKVTFEVGVTSCPKSSADESCALDTSQDKKTCSVVIYSQPWTHTEEITSSSCAPSGNQQRRKRGIPGGYTDIDVNDENVQKAVRLGLAALEQGGEGNSKKLKAIEVIRAQRQVVAGFKYDVEFKVGVTTCPQGSSDDSCALDPNEVVKNCNISLLVQSWTNTEEIISSSCAPVENKQRRKRSCWKNSCHE